MMRRTNLAAWCFAALMAALPTASSAQQPPYDVFPPAEPPYYRVRYEASAKPGELIFPANYTIWIPPGVKSIRGVVVHQHGCGEGSCKSGLTGAYDLHWQALAKKHDCALLAPSYEQPEKADCQMWCDPRNGSDAAFQKGLADLGAKSGHPELAQAPWALWGHSGGGHWAGGMAMLHPERVVAAWLRSGVPLLKAEPGRTGIKAHTLSAAALGVPLLCNPGTKEGVTVKDGRFKGVWPGNEVFFNEVRGQGGKIGVAVDPLTAHECGNQRYFAIPWLDACLTARLPASAGQPLKEIPAEGTWLAPILGGEAAPAGKFEGDPLKAGWLPNEAVAKAWTQYVKDSAVADATAPPAPTNLRANGAELLWEAEADLESGLAGFVIERDGAFLAQVPEKGANPFGRPIFQNLQYSDTPTQPLVPMQFVDAKPIPGKRHAYRVVAVNTAGLKSQPSAEAVAAAPAAGGEAAAASRKPVKVFILAGQSNMEGQGFVAADPKRNGGKGSLEQLVKDPATAARFAPLVDRDGKWRVRDDVRITYLERKGPLTVGYGVNPDRIGPELGFGWVVGDALEEPVLLVKCAWGGKSLAVDFRPPSAGKIPYSLGEKQDAALAADSGMVGKYYRETLALTKAALVEVKTLVPGSDGRYELAGFGWHQGWNDRINDKFNAEYEANLACLIRDVRKALGAPALPFVIAETGMNGPEEKHPRALSLMKAQAAVAKYPEFEGTVAFVPTQRFWRDVSVSPSNQGYHWNTNAETYFLIGDAMGEAMKTLLGRPTAGK